MTHKKHLCKLSALFALASFATLGAVAQSSVPPRITQAIEETKTITLKGHVIPVANAQNDLGPVVDSFDIDHMQLVLQRSPEQEQALNQLMDEQNDRTSPNYHHWLTAAEFGEQFGVAQEDIDKLTSWLESHGFRVNKVYTNRMLIDISGTAGQLQDTFHTSIHQLDVNGEAHIANMSDPRIPEAFAPVVKGFASLNDIKPHPMMKSARQYTVAGCSDASPMLTQPGGTCYFITPQDTQTIYNLNPLYSAGISGQGQTIYLVEDTDVYNATGSSSDWNTYRSTFGLASAYPSGSFTESHPGSCTDPGTNADDGEAALDVEVATSVAPNAAINLISCLSGTVTFGGQIAMLNLINANNPAPTGGGVISVSYGVCEAYNGNGGNALFYNTYQQAAAEGYSVFASSGDEGPSSCSVAYSSTNGKYYNQTSLGVTGWGETPYNVSVGGTDFEDTYNVKKAGASFSTYWNSTNTSGYGSAKSYIPEIPWNDACASALISEVLTSSFTPYGGSPAACNNATFDTDTTYLSTGAAGGGASNCATGAGGTNQGSGISDPECQGYAKPSWQSVYGVPADGVRDIPDVSMFAANGVWGHYEVICWTDPAYTSEGSTANCTGAPNTWSGFGGTSVSAPTMAAIQALVNQKTGETWGNPNPVYYQIAQAEYGTQGGTFAGSSCNSSGTGGPASNCVFNDITQGDIDVACEYIGTTERAHCYLPSSTHGVDSTDNVTAATVIFGGSGYTTAPTCTIAAPTNAAPYKSPTGTTLWAGGTQAKCTATTNAGTTTAVWTVAMNSTSGVGDTIILTNPAGTTTCGPYTLSGASTTAMATNLASAIGTACSLASESRTGSTVTLTAKAAGAAGNFITEFGPATIYDAAYVSITNTTKGQGPNYVSGITITTAGSGYQPETPITLTGGGGSGAIAVANTSVGTAAQSYQPAYGAAPGYDLATGLGSPNAYNLVESTAWLKSQTISWSQQGPYTYGQTPVALTATASSGLAVTYTVSSGPGTINGSTLTITGAGSIVIDANQAGNGAYAAAPQVQQTITINPALLTITASSPTVTYGSAVPTITPSYSGFQNGDNSSVLTTQPTCTTTYTATSNVGSSPTTSCSGAAATNYTFTYVAGAVTVNPASVSITASSPAVTYGSAAPTITPAFGTFQNGQTSSVLTTQPTCSTTYTATSNVGSSPTTSCSGAAAANYTFTYVAGAVTVNPASATINVTPYSVTYDGNAHSATATATGVGNVNLIADLTLNTTHTNAGTYNDSWSFVDPNGNYASASANITDTITQASSTVSVSCPGSVTYNGSAQTPCTASVTGAGSLSQSLTVSYSNNTSAGSATANATFAGDANHTGSSNNGGFTINTAQVTATAGSYSGIYDGSTHALSACQVTGAYTGSLTCNNNPTGPVGPGAGSGTVTPSLGGDTLTNYSITSNSGSWSITQASSTVSVTCPGSVTYNGTAQIPCTASVTGAGGLNQSLTVNYSNNTSAGSATASATFAGDANHTGNSNNGGFIISAAPVTATAGSYSGVYDGSTHALSACQVTGAYTGALICTNNPAGPVGPGVGSGAVTPSVSGDTLTNYSITSNSGSWSITQASSTVSVTCPGSVIYNGTAQAPCTASVTGAGGLNQSLTVNYSNNTSAGTATASATFAGDANHAGNSNNGGFTINPALVTATAGSYSGVYDGSTHALSACQVTGSYTGTLICTNNPAGPVGPGVGSGAVTPSVSGDTLTNYSITSNSGSWNITLASQTISFTTNAPSSEVYNGQFTVAATATSSLAVTFTSSGACSNLGATYTMTSGTGTCFVMANQAGNTNYAAATQVTQTVNATLASQTINFTQPASPATYGASVSLVAAGGSSGNPVTFSVISGPGSVSGANGATLTFTGLGTVVVAANQAGSSNYTAAPQVTRSITVNQAVLTVMANNASMNVGGTVPALTASYSGFVNGDTSAVLGGAPTLSTTATSSSPAGNYPITVTLGTLTAVNYTFNFVNGTFSVVSAPATSTTVSTTVAGSAAAGYVLTITVQNTGTGAISNAVLTAATLGSASGSPLPQTWGTIAVGGAAVFTVNFPGSVGADGASVAERYSGTLAGGSFVGSFRSVTLP